MPQTRRDLYLQVNASTEQFSRAMKSAAADLVTFDGTTAEMLASVQGRFDQLAANDNPAKAIVASFRAAFAEVQRQAKEALTLPTTSAGAINLNVDSAGQAAAAAAMQATALREIADAAAQAAVGVTDTNNALRVYATSAAAAAVAAERDALTLREQADVLTQVQAKLDASGRSAVQTAADLEKIAAASAAVIAAGERLSASLSQQVAAFGLSAEAQRAARVEAAALAAEQQGNAALAAQLRGELARLVALEEDAAQTAVREAGAVRAAGIAHQQFEERVRTGTQALRDQEAALAADAAAAARLREMLDPAAAAQARQAEAIAEARRVMQAYGFTAEETAAVEQRLTGASDGVERSHKGMSLSAMETQHVFRAFGDSVAAGQSPLRAAGMELGRVAQAMSFWAQETGKTEGVVGKFATFLGGFWGMSLTVAVAALAPFVEKLFEAGDATEKALAKLKEDAQETAAATKAHQLFIATLEGQADAQRKLNEQIERGLKSQRQVDRENLDKSQQNLGKQSRELPKAEAELRSARSVLADLGSHPTFAGTTPFASGAPQAASIFFATNDVNAAKKKVDDLKTAIADARQGIRDATIKIAVDDARGLVDPIVAINNRYDDMADAAKKAALGNDRLAMSLRGTLAAIEGQRAGALKAQRERDEATRRAATDNHQSGREITLNDAEAIVRGFGGRITSAERSTAEQQVLYDRYRNGTGPLAAKPGTSLHETGQALDIAKGAGISLAVIREAFRKQGVAVRELLDEGDHFHVGWGKKGKSADQLRDEQARTVQRSFDADASFESEKRKLLDQLFGAGRSGTSDGAARDLAQIAQANADAAEEKKKIADQLGKALADPKTTEQTSAIARARAAELDGLNERVRQQKVDNVRLERASQVIRDQFEAQSRELTGAIGTLELQDQLATTRSERLKIEREILAKERQHKQIEIDRVLRDPKSTDQQRANAQSDQAALDREAPLQGRLLERKNADPLSAYVQQLRSNVGDLNDALGNVKVDALKGLEDGLLGILNGTQSVAQAFTSMAKSIIADLAKIAIEKAIVSGLGSLIPGAGALFGHKDGGLIPAFADGGLNGLFSGIGGPRDDKNLVLISNGEFIVNAAATKRHLPLLKALNDNGLPAFADGGLVGTMPDIRLPHISGAALMRQPVQRVAVETNVNVNASPLFDAHVEQVSLRTVGAAAEPIMIGAQARTTKALRRPTLPGGHGG